MKFHVRTHSFSGSEAVEKQPDARGGHEGVAVGGRGKAARGVVRETARKAVGEVVT